MHAMYLVVDRLATSSSGFARRRKLEIPGLLSG
jgi:hypothetical protein